MSHSELNRWRPTYATPQSASRPTGNACVAASNDWALLHMPFAPRLTPFPSTPTLQLTLQRRSPYVCSLFPAQYHQFGDDGLPPRCGGAAPTPHCLPRSQRAPPLRDALRCSGPPTAVLCGRMLHASALLDVSGEVDHGAAPEHRSESLPPSVNGGWHSGWCGRRFQPAICPCLAHHARNLL